MIVRKIHINDSHRHIRLCCKPFIGILLVIPSLLLERFSRKMPALILNDTRFLNILLTVKEAVVFQCSKQAIKRRIDGNSFLTFRKRFNYRKFARFINIKSHSGIRVCRKIVVSGPGFIGNVARKRSCSHFNGTIPVIAVLLINFIEFSAVPVEIGKNSCPLNILCRIRP